jgi:hypothetical protein
MSVYYGPNVTAEALSFATSGQTLNIVYNGPYSATMTKVGSDSWDTQAYSLIPYIAPCTIEFNKNAAAGDNGVSYTMVGWNADPLTDASYTSIDWASYPYAMNNYTIYNNGSGVGTGIVWDQTKKFYIVYDTDGYVRHWNGSTLLYTGNKGTGQTVYFDSSFYSGNAFGSLKNVRIIKRSWNGTYYV